MLEGFTPIPKEWQEKYLKEGYWQGKTVGDIVDEAARKWPDRVAITFEDTRITYKEMVQNVDRLALHLLNLGLKRLDRMILQMPNTPSTIYLYFAAVKAGVIPIMTLPAHRFAEISFFAELGQAAAYAIPGTFNKFDYVALADEVRLKAPSMKYLIINEEEVPEGAISLPKILNDPIEKRVDAGKILSDARPDPFDPALFQLSGGTTGIPKMIPRTHDDYYYNSLMSQRLSGFSQDTVYLLGIPITHNFPTACPGFQGVFLSGGRAVIASNPTPDALMSLIQKEKVTAIPAVPAVVIGMLKHPDLKKYDLSSLKLFQVGGSKLGAEVAKEIFSKLGVNVQQILGMAEGPLFFTRLDDPEDIKCHTQGRPISPGDEFKIVDDQEREVPAGEVGELLCRGPYTIRGYFSAPEHNARAFTSDGFYKSGDLCRMHPSGNVIVEGRNKDTINRGGEKISAEEVENHIMAFPKIVNCAYVAMPDPILGERACVFAVPAPGRTFDLKELNDFLLKERKIARFKAPERLELLDTLPVTNVGKISKVRLREIIARKLKEEKR